MKMVSTTNYIIREEICYGNGSVWPWRSPGSAVCPQGNQEDGWGQRPEDRGADSVCPDLSTKLRGQEHRRARVGEDGCPSWSREGLPLPQLVCSTGATAGWAMPTDMGRRCLPQPADSNAHQRNTQKSRSTTSGARLCPGTLAQGVSHHSASMHVCTLPRRAHVTPVGTHVTQVHMHMVPRQALVTLETSARWPQEPRPLLEEPLSPPLPGQAVISLRNVTQAVSVVSLQPLCSSLVT